MTTQTFLQQEIRGNKRKQEETRGEWDEREWKRGNQREGINNDHQEKEAKDFQEMHLQSQGKWGRGELERVLTKGDINKSHIRMGVKKYTR